MTPEAVIEEVNESGLRGRGGGGFPTGRKWRSARHAPGDAKYVICNADEGDPGAYMDRSLMEGNPHSVLEGMIIGAYAIGANQGLHLRPQRVPAGRQNISELAIEQAGSYGFLGKNILGTGFDFDVRINRGGGAFVCGEVHRPDGLPRGQGRRAAAPSTSTPSRQGLWDKPTDLNNVETWANVPLIINRAPTGIARIGTDKQQGHQDLLPGGQDQQHRPGRGAHGHHPARDHLRHRRRHPRGQEVQGGADRRPLRRLHPARACSTCRWTSTS